MTDLGVILNNSTLLLELLTKNELGEYVWADSNPSAVVTNSDGLSVIEVANVKLDEMSNVGEYAYNLVIPSEWTEGVYTITYSATVNGVDLTLQEEFELQHVIAEEELEVIEIPEYGDVVFGDRNNYLLPSEFQIEAELIVTETGVTIKPKEDLKYNHTYTLVIGKGIKSVDQERTFENTEHITFSSEYSPLYATPLEVRAIIRNFFQYFSIDDIYAALRDAGEKAHVYKDLVPDANNSRFKMAKERDTYYFALTKYQAFEASRVLLTKLLFFILQGNGNPSNGTLAGGGNNGDGSFTLGDFTAGDDKVSLADLATMLSANKGLIEDMLRQIEADLKFWQDSMLGHNRRSYAKPTSASFRSDAGSPGSREF